ncbi:MAG: major capsid protein [Pseudomonadota bacterium]
MATMDIFDNSAFRTRELSDAIDDIPNQFGMIGEMGLFIPKPIRTQFFMLEERNGVLQLLQSSARGTPLPGSRRGRRDLRAYSTLRFGQSRNVTADDIDGIRAFGSESELVQVMDEVAERQTDIRQNVDITREYLRSGALRGVVSDADGTLILDLFAEFGVSQTEIDFDFGAADAQIQNKANDVRRAIELNLRGDVMTGVGALCSPGFWDALMANESFREAYKFQSGLTPLREDLRDQGVSWQGIYWKEYLGQADVPQEDGTTISRNFIASGDARFFPMGTRNTFRQYNAPADYMDVINTPGQAFYSSMGRDPSGHNRFVSIEGQMNTVPICMRPRVLVRGHSTT